MCRILYAARRPADPVKSCPCFILRRFLPCASYLEISFCTHFGALRLSARLIGGGWFYSESMILSRLDYFIPHYIGDPGGSHALILMNSVLSACNEVGWAGSSQWASGMYVNGLTTDG